MKAILVVAVFGFLTQVLCHEVSQGYHFHVYFIHTNKRQLEETIKIRDHVLQEIEEGFLPDCSLSSIIRKPIGPHTFGQFFACCNVSSVGNAVSFFMQNRGNQSILLHRLSESEVKDHNERAFWLGPAIPLDEDNLGEDLGYTPQCRSHRKGLKADFPAF